MNGGEFIERFRQDMTDEETPPLWSDALILRYLTDTQEDFCRLTEGIPDSMSDLPRHCRSIEGHCPTEPQDQKDPCGYA